MLVWVVSCIWAYIAPYFSFTEIGACQIWVNILSTLNNLFWLLALYYVYDAPKFIYQNEKIIGIIIIVVASVIVLLSLFIGSEVYFGFKIAVVPDVLLTTFLCYLLGVSFLEILCIEIYRS